MQIERGMQPNCSELVIRLGTSDRDEALDLLSEVGLKEYLICNKWDWEKKPREWDDASDDVRVIETKDLPKKVRNAWRDYNNGDNDAKVAKSIKILEEAGIKPGVSTVSIVDEKEENKKENSDAWISKYPYGEDGELALWYHQHCTVRGFPILKRVADHVGEDVEPHDGGSIHYYDEWAAGRDPFEGEE